MTLTLTGGTLCLDGQPVACLLSSVYPSLRDELEEALTLADPLAVEARSLEAGRATGVAEGYRKHAELCGSGPVIEI